jgi:hypothetical protein
MMRAAMRNPVVTVALLLAATSLPAACKSADKDKSAPSASTTTGTDQVQISNGSITVKTDAGTFAIGGDTKIPDDFPAAVPIYPGAKATLAGKSSSGPGKPSWSVTLETPDDGAKVVAFYKSKLASFTVASDLAVGDSNMTAWQGPKYDVSLMVAAVPGEQPSTSIMLAVTGK